MRIVIHVIVVSSYLWIHVLTMLYVIWYLVLNYYALVKFKNTSTCIFKDITVFSRLDRDISCQFLLTIYTIVLYFFQKIRHFLAVLQIFLFCDWIEIFCSKNSSSLSPFSGTAYLVNLIWLISMSINLYSEYDALCKKVCENADPF